MTLRILRHKFTVALTAATLTVASAVCAQSTLHYEQDPAGKTEVKMEGTSSIHEWEVIGKIVVGSIDANPNFPDSALKAGGDTAKPKAAISIPVRSLKSQVLLGAGTMDGVMRDHMEETNFPRIVYLLTDLKPKGSTNGAVQFDAVGTLSVHGVTNNLTMPVLIKRDGKNLTVTGSTPLKMSAFKIPPVAPKILGMAPITTGDEVQISFTWVLIEKPPGGAK